MATFVSSPYDRDTAAVELCGAVQGLIRTKTVPDYMVEFLQSRVDAVRRSQGLAPQIVTQQVKEPA